jgi:hypothetical protein
MTLSRKIADAVESRLESGGDPGVVEAAEGSATLRISLTAAGPVGLAFDTLAFSKRAEGAEPLASEALRAWGETLANRLTYLMEPLVVLEVDAEVGEAELRSRTPTARNERSSYYELRLNRDRGLQLRRVGFDRLTRERQPVPCQMTIEVLERLADDLVASLP